MQPLTSMASTTIPLEQHSIMHRSNIKKLGSIKIHLKVIQLIKDSHKPRIYYIHYTIAHKQSKLVISTYLANLVKLNKGEEGQQ